MQADICSIFFGPHNTHMANPRARCAYGSKLRVADYGRAAVKGRHGRDEARHASHPATAVNVPNYFRIACMLRMRL